MPPKAKHSQPPRFLFVNEDADTVNRVTKNPDVDREKQSHAQRHSFAKRRQLKNQALPLRPVWKDLTPSTTADTSKAREPEHDWGSINVHLGSDLRMQPWQLDLNADRSLDLVEIASHPALHKSGQLLRSSPARRGNKKSMPSIRYVPPLQAPLQGRGLHPLFSGSAQILGKWAPPLIQFFNMVVIPEKFPDDVTVRPLGQIRHAAAIHADCSTALAAPVHLYAFLAEATTRMLDREGKLLLPDVREEDYHRVILLFRAKAITALRHALTGGLTHALVTDVHHLIAAYYLSHDYQTATPHVDAMLSMIEMLGGMQTFGDYFQETALLQDWSAALKILGAPRLPMYWDPGLGSPAISAIGGKLGLQPDGLGKRMFSIFTETEMRPEISKAFQDMIQLIRFRRWTMNQLTYNPAHYRYALLRHTAIGCRLLLVGDDPTKGPQEEAFRIAMIFWTALTRSPSSGKRCASVRVSRLRGVLESTSPHIWAGYYDWLLWTSVIGGLTAMSEENVDWFATAAAKAARTLNNDTLMDLADMENVLSGFLYEPSMQREPLLDFRLRMRKVSDLSS